MIEEPCVVGVQFELLVRQVARQRDWHKNKKGFLALVVTISDFYVSFCDMCPQYFL